MRAGTRPPRARRQGYAAAVGRGRGHGLRRSLRICLLRRQPRRCV